MKNYKLLSTLFAMALTVSVASAADIYVSLETGKNSNEGTKEAPLKNLWKALDKSQVGDTIHLAEGIYPGQMKRNWFMMEKPVSIIGGYAKDFSERNPLTHKTMIQPLNENNDKKGNGQALLHLEFDRTNNAPKGFKMTIDGLVRSFRA